MTCQFCQFINGEIKIPFIHEDEEVLAFNDINPQAPHHVLIIPRKHIATINDLESVDTPLLGHMVQSAKRIASDLKLSDNGFRLVFNCNKAAGQSVFHIHLHLLGGRQLQWPPG
jgi:histidine triad (HIT) family protein